MNADESLEQYVLKHIDKEGEYLHALYRDTQINLLYPRMASGHLQGRLLKMLVKLVNPQRILELGTFSGYSALSMAEGLQDSGEIYTFEINDEQEVFTRPWFDGSPYGKKIHFIIGNALELVPKLNLIFDMAFIDADKRQYIEYYEMVLKYLRPGGLILADNTLWDGHVVEERAASDRQTQGIRAFNDYVARDERVEKVIIPLRDGLTMIRKK